MENLIVLDHNTKNIHLYKLDVDGPIDDVFIAENTHHNVDNISWMVVDKIDIIRHKGILK